MQRCHHPFCIMLKATTKQVVHGELESSFILDYSAVEAEEGGEKIITYPLPNCCSANVAFAFSRTKNILL